jgi:tetratricopeptide (TPR) repeat protein
MSGRRIDTILTYIVLAVLIGYSVKCYRQSADRRTLVIKWAATLLLVLLMPVVFWLHNPRVLLFFLVPCVILAFVWLPNLVETALSPLLGAFTGGTEEAETKPFYFIANAKRMKSLPQEAADEVRKQLEKFPGDVTGMMLLAAIQAEDLRDVVAAKATIDELLEQPDLKPQQIATALHTLADWQLQFGPDAEAARETLEHVIRTLPDSQFSHAAEQRIAHLADVVATRDFRENAKFEVRPGERDIGLKKTPNAAAVSSDPEELAEQYVRQLEKYPNDTDTREKLAVLYAEHFQRLDLAADQLEQLISVPDETPKHVARWLNLLATFHVAAHDEESARNALRRIIQKFPKASHAEIAARRLSNLRNELKSGISSSAKTLGNYQKDLGLNP